MRYTLRMMIMLLGLLLISYNGSGDKAVGSIMIDNHTFSSGYNSSEAAKTMPEDDLALAANKSDDLTIEEYKSDAISESSMQNSIIAAAVYVNSLPAATADQLVLQ